jgi:hypothetical protein
MLMAATGHIQHTAIQPQRKPTDSILLLLLLLIISNNNNIIKNIITITINIIYLFISIYHL